MAVYRMSPTVVPRAADTKMSSTVETSNEHSLVLTFDVSTFTSPIHSPTVTLTLYNTPPHPRVSRVYCFVNPLAPGAYIHPVLATPGLQHDM
jgi:hypothetical protein